MIVPKKILVKVKQPSLCDQPLGEVSYPRTKLVIAVNARLCWKTIKLDWRCVVQHATLSKKMPKLFKTYPKS